MKNKKLPFSRPRVLLLLLPIIGCMGIVFQLFISQANAATGIHQQINFQGKLVDGNGLNVTDSTYSVVFSLYSVSSGGVAIWTETQSVDTTDGLFQVKLGSQTALPGSVDFNTDNLYLGVKVGADAEMTPRIRFSAVPYAFNSQKVAGLTVTNTTGTLTIPNGEVIQFADSFSTTGAFTLNLTTTGTTSITLPTTGTLLTNTATANQTFTSTQTSGTVLGITDTTAITNATTGLAITLSGSGAFNQTGLSFNLSGASGASLNDIVGSGGTWRVSRAGALTVASCTGCGSGGTNYLRTNDGTFSLINDTADFLFGSNASSSAKFKVSPSGTSPTASISGQTSSAALIVDNRGSGDLFTASASGLARFTIQNNGNVGIGTSTPTDKLEIAGTVTNSGDLQGLSMTLGADGDVDTTNALNIGVTSANTGDADVVNGVNIDNLTNGNATVQERGIRVGTGWSNGTGDADIALDDTTPVIRLGATDNTGELSIQDSAATPNTLVQIKDLSTNFGASVLAGAFVNFNSMVAEEFNRTRTTITNSGTDTAGSQGGAFGNGGGWGVYGNGANCTFSTLADTVNGITRMAASTAGRGCMTMIDDAVNNAKLMYNVANLPVIVMKIRPSQADTNSAVYAGLGNSTDGVVAAPASFIGLSNDNAGTLGNTWVGITRNAGTSTTVVCTGQTISTTQFALLMIEVRSSSNVKFFVDNNVSDGVNFTECGSGSSTNIHTSNLAPQIHWQERTGGAASNLDLDYFRSWQDDAAFVEGLTAESGEALTFEESSTGSSYDANDLMKDLLVQDEVAEEEGLQDAGKGELLAGLEPLTKSIASLEEKIASMEAKINNVAMKTSPTTEPTQTATSSAGTSDRLKTDNLAVAGLATISATLRVQGNGLIEGMLNVVDTLTVNNFIVNKIANFFDQVIFHRDVVFRDTAYFNPDTAGYVTVAKDQDKAKVTFAKPYEHEPVINASVVTTSMSDEAFADFAENSMCDKDAGKVVCEEKLTQDALVKSMPYIITERSNEGFIIKLSKPASQDLQFSWTAISTEKQEEILTKGGDDHDSNKE